MSRADPLADARQGDLINVAPLIALTAASSELAVEEIRGATGYALIVSQTCDLRREDEQEPWIQTSPVEDLKSEADWKGAEGGLTSMRRYALPSSHGLAHPIVDVRHVQSITKAAIRLLGLKVDDSGFTRAQRETFSEWLARRYGRHAFPDDLEKAVLRPLRDVLAQRRGNASPDGGVIRARDCILVRDSPPALELLVALNPVQFVSEPSLRGDLTVASQGISTIAAAVANKKAYRESGYKIAARVETADKVTLQDRRGYIELMVE